MSETEEAVQQTLPPRHRTPSPIRLRGKAGWGLAVAGTIAVIALVATGPLWAPLLPWAGGNEPAPDARTAPVEAASPALRELDRRLAALEAKPAVSPGDLTEIRQRLDKLQASTADLGARIDATEKAARSRNAADPTDIALVLALLQIRDAIEAGRPFAAAYETLIALAKALPEVAAVAAPLAEPATTGLPGRPVLANRLREIADAIAKQAAPASPDADTPGWADQALRHLGGLVSIRRVGGGGRTTEGEGPAAAANAALRALAGGDLAGAVGLLDKLTGTPAETAAPWLRMARQRLAAEASLQQIEALLAARLGTPANAPAGSGPSR